MRTISLSMTAALVLASACNPGPKNTDEPAAVKDSTAKAAPANLAPLSIISYRPQVPEKEYLCMIGDNPIYVKANANGNALHPDRSDTISLLELTHKLPTNDPRGKYIRGLEFYYGLDTESNPHRLVLAVQFVMLLPQEDEDASSDEYDRYYYSPRKFFAIEKNKLVSIDSAVWWNKYAVNYAQHVKIDHDGNGSADALDANDRKAYLMNWDKAVEVMIANNPFTQYVLVEHTAENMNAHGVVPKDWRHHLAMVAADGSYQRIIDDVPAPSTHPYTGKGADLGSPCPPLCGKKVKFLKQGNTPRPGCQ